ncbi:MAG TPA: hypothetical protein VI522_08715, partial [Gammaproteobacteria bacterium]|nr:hypothetical protein [Gammaproteobacteria bacterium]
MTKQIILTVYFNGAWCEHYDTDNLAGFLFANTHTGESNNTLHAKMSFDGCMGYTGILFGNGTKAHVEAVKAYVISFLKKGYAVTLNVYGHSRGGVEALFLAKELSHFPKEEVSINLALMDPTPVNLFLTSELDKAYGFTWANQVMDLSACHNLAHLCAIYTNQPYNAGPSVQAIREQFMAPIFPKFPAQCKVQVEIIAGYHSQAQAINNDGWITNHHILTFLTDRGSVFNPTLSQNYSSDKLCQHYHAMLNFYRSATDCGPNATRSFHADQSFYIRTQ